jgi:peptide/nickel transport system substrate-binding protein
MRTGSKGLGGLVAIGTAAALLLSGCTGAGTTKQFSVSLAECDQKPNDCNTGPTKDGGSLTVALEKKLVNWNTNSAKGNVADIVDVLLAVQPSPVTIRPDNTAVVNDQVAESIEVTSKSPQTVVYRIRKNAVWSDGTPIGVDDFIYAWKTQNGKDCPDCDAASITGYDQIASITGADGGKTITTVYSTPYPDYMSLFLGLFPAHIAKAYGDDGTPTGLLKAWDAFKDKQYDWSGYAYKIGEYQKDVSLTLVRNDRFWGAKPKLDKIVYRVLADQGSQVPALKNKEVQMLTSQPSQAIVDETKAIPGVDYALTRGPNWEHLTFNTKNKFLADAPLRKAMATAINTKEIITKTIGFFPAAAPLGNRMLLPGQEGYQDNLAGTGYGSGDLEKAKKILTDAGYTVGTDLKTKAGEVVPPLRFRYSEGNVPRQQAVELMQNSLKGLGIQVTIQPTASLGDTLEEHDFDAIIFAFIGGPFLTPNVDLWKTGGGGNFSQWSNPAADKLLDQVATELDMKKAADLLNQVDVLVTADMPDLPLFQKPVYLAVDHNYVNIRPNATQVGPQYNVHQWATRATGK